MAVSLYGPVRLLSQWMRSSKRVTCAPGSTCLPEGGRHCAAGTASCCHTFTCLQAILASAKAMHVTLFSQCLAQRVLLQANLQMLAPACQEV